MVHDPRSGEAPRHTPGSEVGSADPMDHSNTTLARLAVTLACIAALLVTVPPVSAEEPLGDTLPSFAESPGCGTLDGFRGPLVPSAGQVPLSTPIYGPWAHMFGRTEQAVWDQQVIMRLPNGAGGLTKGLYVHERLAPALQQVADNLTAAAAAGQTYRIWDSQTWSFSAYTIPPTRKLSFHAVGAAIDVNSLLNPYRSDNTLITNMPEWFVDAWRDAGWCWGGDWQTIKDPMHFSWMGPMFTPGYEMPPPQPPLVAAASFEAAMDVVPALTAGSAGPEIVADIDRDGAVDVVRLETLTDTGQVTLRAAVARHSFETCASVSVTESAPGDPSAPAYLEDFSGDGRPDLAYLDLTGATVQVEVFTAAHAEAMARSLRTTAVAVLPGDGYAFDDHDRDGAIDLYVIRAGAPARLEIWLGPGFDLMAHASDLGVPSAGHRFDAADRDVDGIPDLYALGEDGTLTVHLAATGFAAESPVATGLLGAGGFSLHDLDGDGHPDGFVVADDGSVVARRGGGSTHDPGIWYELPEDGWIPGDGCGTPYPRCDNRPATLIGTDDDDRLWGSAGVNVVWAGAGNDLIETMAGNDRVCAGPGDDVVRGGDGKDVLRGGDGRDILWGGLASDRLTGGAGDDALYGEGGTRDRLSGGSGIDWLNAGPGGDDRCSDDAADTLVNCEAPL